MSYTQTSTTEYSAYCSSPGSDCKSAHVSVFSNWYNVYFDWAKNSSPSGYNTQLSPWAMTGE